MFIDKIGIDIYYMPFIKKPFMKKKYIHIVNNISNKDFKKYYLAPQKPLIIKGLTDTCVARTKWTMDYIASVCGDVTVDLFDNLNSNKASAFTTPDRKMKFADYINIVAENKPTSLRMFLFNMFKAKPQLRKDFPCPKIFRGVLGRMGFMFFGAKNIKVRIHQDMDMSNVMLTQFYGRKKVVLIAPIYSALLYKLPFNTHSLIDLDNPNYEKYPGLKYIETYECILEHGDSLFIPSGYWHYITYVDGGFSVSYRKLSGSLKNILIGLLNLCIYTPFDKLMNKLVKEKWLVKKEKIAEVRAQKVINQIEKDLHKPEAVDIQFQPN
ncbi:MAG TPA: cupin-like domain-containing protein [Bacteroidia bacterium]|nr:cupin-like domain-containing protein [Bacteroidia bacterium]